VSPVVGGTILISLGIINQFKIKRCVNIATNVEVFAPAGKLEKRPADNKCLIKNILLKIKTNVE